MFAKIVKITDRDGKPKTDPMRVGAIVYVYPAKVGALLYMDYIADGAGNPINGLSCTSTVQDVAIKVTTRNSVYVLKELAGSHV